MSAFCGPEDEESGDGSEKDEVRFLWKGHGCV